MSGCVVRQVDCQDLDNNTNYYVFEVVNKWLSSDSRDKHDLELLLRNYLLKLSLKITFTFLIKLFVVYNFHWFLIFIISSYAHLDDDESCLGFELFDTTKYPFVL